MIEVMELFQTGDVTPRLVTGAFSLSSVDFLVPLIAQGNTFTVLILPPLEFSSLEAFENRNEECLDRGYLVLRTPIHSKKISILGRTHDDSIKAAHLWYLLGIDELRQANLTNAEKVWRKNAVRIIDVYRRELSKFNTPLQPPNIAVSWIRTLYNISGCSVRVNAHSGIIRLPLAKRTSPEDYQFVKTLVKISDSDGLTGRLSGRGSLQYRRSSSKQWEQVRLLRDVVDNRVNFKPLSVSPQILNLQITENEIRLFDEPNRSQIELRPLGSLRLVHLASFGIMAHIPWYVKSPNERFREVWRTSAKAFIFPHAPLSAAMLNSSNKESGSYLWDCCPTPIHSDNNLVQIASLRLGNIESSDLMLLTNLAQGLRGPRSRRSKYSHARGYVANNWRTLSTWSSNREITASSEAKWGILDCFLFSVSIWIALRQQKKNLHINGKIELDAFIRLLGENRFKIIEVFVSSVHACGHKFTYPQELIKYSLTKITNWEDFNRTSISRMVRGWFEISSGLLETFWKYCETTLSSDITLVAALCEPIKFNSKNSKAISHDVVITRR